MKHAVGRFAAALVPLALLVFALGMSLCMTLYLQVSVAGMALSALALTALFAAWFYSGRTTAAGLALAAATLLVLWWIMKDALWVTISDFFGQTFRFIGGGDPVAERYRPALALVCMALSAAVVTLIGRGRGAFPALLVLTAALLLTEWLFGHYHILPTVIPAAIALVMLMAKSHQLRTERIYRKSLSADAMALWTLPTAALIVVFSWLLLFGRATDQWKWDWLVDRAERINDYLSDYTDFSRPRNTFSLSSTGFSPYADRLGGAVVPDDTEVLWVATKRPVLLRGVVFNEYDGYRWYDTTASSRYRISALNNRPVLADVFDLNRPDAPELQGELERMLVPTEITVIHLTMSPSSMFVPFRISRVDPTKRFDLIVYFNDKGEVFTTRDMRPGSGYTIEAVLPDYKNPEFPALMARLLAEAAPDDPQKMESIGARYLALPENTMSPVVYKTTEIIARGAANDFEKAARIRDYLATHFRYTTTPPEPQGGDFVTEFFDSGEGYCTYFASAMAVMARIAGLPSRYVEGYRVVPGPRNECTVTNESAHAWAEVYFEGIGWIPFDATPSGREETDDTPREPGPAQPSPIEPEEPTPEPDSVLPPLPAPAPSRVPLALGITGGLALLALAALAAFSRLRTAMWVVRRLRPDPAGQVRYLFGDILSLLLMFNSPVKTGETLYTYAHRIDRWLAMDGLTLTQIADIVVRMTYSERPPTDGEVQTVARFRYLLARYTLRASGALRYFRERALRVRG